MNPGELLLDHVALGVPRIAEGARFLVDELGGEEHEAGPGMGFQFFQWRFAGGGVIELLEPEGPPGGFLHRFLERRGPGVHHVTFKVGELETAAERARAAGYEIVGWFDSMPSWKECFLHPKQAQGIVVQLAESNSELGEWSPERWTEIDVGERPAVVPEPVRLTTLRLSARDATAARRQWHEALGGEARDLGEGEIEFRWGASPLRIVVAIRPDAEVGPLQIELETDRAWPAAGRTELGARFVRVGP